MDVRNIIANWLMFNYSDDLTSVELADAILAALKEAGYAVVRVEPKAWGDVLEAAFEQEEDRLRRRAALDELGEMDGKLLD